MNLDKRLRPLIKVSLMYQFGFFECLTHALAESAVAWGFTTPAAVGHRQILNKKKPNRLRLGFFFI